jgi:hypothetical protein
VTHVPASRRTAAARNFSVADLDDLSRENRRQLCQLLLAESGLRILGGDQRADYDQFLVEVSPMWRARQGCVRVIYRPVTQADLDDVEQLAKDRGFADALLFEAGGAGVATNHLRCTRVQVVTALELVERLEAAALITWRDDLPAPDLDQYALLREVDQLLPSLDPVGLRWLMTLSLNKLPQELAHLGQPPDRLFERVVFRMFTSVFRFGGTRLGARAAGTPAPDSILSAPAGAPTPFSALTDCKAARDGYVMDMNAERALRDYVRDYREPAERDGGPLRYLVVTSSRFPGGRNPHPYAARARRLREQTNTSLVYLRAADLLVLAVAVERDEASPNVRSAIDWVRIFDDGLVGQETLLSAYGAAR